MIGWQQINRFSQPNKSRPRQRQGSVFFICGVLNGLLWNYQQCVTKNCQKPGDSSRYAGEEGLENLETPAKCRPQNAYWLWTMVVWPTNGWICDSNILCDDSNTTELCCKFIFMVGFWKMFEFQLIFGDLRALEFEGVDGQHVSNLFLKYSCHLFYSPTTRNQPKTPHNDDKIHQFKDIGVFHFFFHF